MAHDSPHSGSSAWWAGLVAVTALLIYWRGPLLGFAGDDALVLYHLRRLGGLEHPAAFFTSLDFFTFYRPFAFLTFAADAAVWSLGAGGFHLTNVLLHAANGTLVFFLGRRILPPWAAAVAAVLFVAHASNQEAVYWISARFDLLATLFTLATVLLATRRMPAWSAVSLATFGLGLLSKEAALAAPVIVGAYLVFVDRAGPRRVATVLGLMLGVIAAYAALRSVVGGLDVTGGSSRLPKAAMLLSALGLMVWLARGGWERIVERASEIRPIRALIVGLGLAAVAIAVCVMPAGASIFGEKLAFLGFAGFYLLSPVVSLPAGLRDAATEAGWAGGIAMALVAGGLLVALRRHVRADTTWLFVLATAAAALIPVSSLTEGPRYLYLASVGVSLGAGRLAADTQGRARGAVVALLGLVFAVSVWQIQLKGQDWAWSSGMTARAVALVNADLPACGQGDVVFLVAPVGIRGVYSNIYHQTFSQAGGCEPGSYQVVIRMLRTDQPIEVRWVSPRTVVVRAPAYRGNFVLSSDLREFTVEQRSNRYARLATPLGLVTSRPDGEAQEVTLQLAPSLDLRPFRFYYFAMGEMRRAPPQ